MNSVAFGELLTVGAVPFAVFVAVIAAILAGRFRRLAIGLVVAGLVSCIAMLVAGRHLSAPLVAARERQTQRFANVEIGLEQAEVEALMGAPDLRCPGAGSRDHEARSTETLRHRLYESTEERWIYFLDDTVDAAEHADCLPLYADGVVAFNAEGRVLWFVELTGERFMSY